MTGDTTFRQRCLTEATAQVEEGLAALHSLEAAIEQTRRRLLHVADALEDAERVMREPHP